MKLLLAVLVWLAMGTVLGWGLLKAIAGNPWLLIIGIVGFIVAVGRVCATSH